MPFIEIVGITKSFGTKTVFKDFSLSIERGEMVAIIGDSGRGKTTLLNMIGLLEKCDSGKIIIDGRENIVPNSRIAGKLLRETISYLFQSFALVEDETVIYNLLLALKYTHHSKAENAENIKSVLEFVGLQEYENRKIFQLSGGEQQRVAIARIMLKPCEIILADEPTGSLDNNNREVIMHMLYDLNMHGKTIVIVTHDPYVAEKCNRQIKI